jgi:cold shock CspA family protein
MLGRVVRFDSRKAYGRVRGLDHRDYYVLRTDLVDVRSLAPDQRVAFTPAKTVRGLKAVNVRIIEEATLRA